MKEEILHVPLWLMKQVRETLEAGERLAFALKQAGFDADKVLSFPRGSYREATSFRNTLKELAEWMPPDLPSGASFVEHERTS